MPIVAGFIGTAGITMTLWAINKTGWTNADMVRAIGSFITRSYENSLHIGLIIHFFSGIIMSTAYLHIISVMEVPNILSLIFVGGSLGFGQGFIVGWAIIRFSEYHPIEEFQKADYQVAIAHIIGHIVYGGLIGAVFGVFRLMGFDVSPGI